MFKALFLSTEGIEAAKHGLIPTGNDRFYRIKMLVLDISQIESYYETDDVQLNHMCCNVIMRSGVSWTLMISLSELVELRKSRLIFYN